MNIVVSGTRNADVTPYQISNGVWLCAYAFSRQPKDEPRQEVPVTILHGDSGNVDKVADEWARGCKESHDVRVKPYPAEWDRYGKPAGPLRNAQMADDGDALLAFWDGFSDGTHDMIQKMLKNGKPALVFPIGP